VARLFVSQDQLDRWTVEGKVKLEEDLMTLPAMSRSFRLRPAVHFTALVEGVDRERLIGRVKTEEQLAQIGAEHYGSSVLVGELGYECEEGFVGVPAEGSAGGASGLLRLGG
jgi:hypothetical protein